MKTRLLSSALFACLFALPLAAAAPPRDELLRLVPPDAGFVVIIQDARAHFDRIRNSPFVKLLKSSAPDKWSADAPEWKQLAELDELVQREIGVTLPKLRDEVLGDAIVLVWKPGPPEQPEADHGVVLVWPRDAKLAAGMFERLDAAQTKSGQLKEVGDRAHAGQLYKRRVRRDEPDEFQYQRGNVLAFGSSEPLLKQIIDADVAGSKSAPALAVTLRSLQLAHSAVIWWANPRAFDAAIAHKQKSAAGPEAVVVSATARHWQALDSLAGYIQIDDDLRIGLAVAARPDAMPASTRQFFREAGKPSTLASVMSKNALVTISGRFSLPAIIDAGAEFLPAEARKNVREATGKTIAAALGPDATAALPNRLGPDWAVSVMPPPAQAKSSAPIVTAAIRLDDSGSGPPVAPRVMDGLNALAMFAAIGYNSNNTDAIALRNERIGDIEIRYFVGDRTFPPGIRPAFAWTQGYLIFASSPEAVTAFRAPAQATSVEPTPMVRINCQSIVRYLTEHRTAAAEFLTVRDICSLIDANKHIDELVRLLNLFHAVELNVWPGDLQARIELKFEPVAKLK